MTEENNTNTNKENNTDMTGVKFNFESEMPSVIKIVGVGGGGGNAATYMFNEGQFNGVDFMICNTDHQALVHSSIPTKVLLGEKGLGAGAKPLVGREKAIEKLPEIQELLKGTELVFVTAGLGGGTGTGAAPVIANAAKEMGILTIGIVTIPFRWEGKRKVNNALNGLKEMRDSVDSIIILTNDRIGQMYGDLNVDEAFSQANKVLTTAAKGVAGLIADPLDMNVDLEDVRTVMQDGGDAIMGTGIASGADRAVGAIQQALTSPLLINCDMKKAKNLLMSVTYGKSKMRMDEFNVIIEYLEKEGYDGEHLIYGYGLDEKLGDDEIRVTMIAAGMNVSDEMLNGVSKNNEPEVKTPEPKNQETEVTPTQVYNTEKFYEKTATQKTQTTQTVTTPTIPVNPPVEVIVEKKQEVIEVDVDNDEALEAHMHSRTAYSRSQEISNSYFQEKTLSQNFSIAKGDEGLTNKNGYLHDNVD